jgi:hypothetical protein
MDYRFDYVFSYWIFAWFLLYEFGYTSYNPKIALIIALIENIGILCLMIYFKIQVKKRSQVILTFMF